MTSKVNPSLLGEKVVKGRTAAIAQAISLAEEQSEEAEELLEYLYPYQGKAHRLGVSGPPGAGKSSFVNQLIKRFRASGQKVGVVAIDPSSPFSGGAILGDRLRMNQFGDDSEVFIRSMATRGYKGGLSRSAVRAADIFDAAGKDAVIFETVGAGQAELDVMTAADTIIVVSAPGAGDVIQNMKAGLMEIGDILTVNKSDLPGAESTMEDIEFVLEEQKSKTGRRPPLYLTNSLKGEGVEEVFEAVVKRFERLKESGALKEKRRRSFREQARLMAQERALKLFWTPERLNLLNERGQNRDDKISPQSLTAKIMKA